MWQFINGDIMRGGNLSAEIPIIDLVCCTTSILIWIRRVAIYKRVNMFAARLGLGQISRLIQIRMEVVQHTHLEEGSHILATPRSSYSSH
jgi:hypothetical protein